jgi:putative hemolysin
MRTITLQTLSLHVLSAASLLLATVTHADDPAYFARGGNSNRVVQGVNAQGTLLRYPEAQWSSRIGTGTAASAAKSGNPGSIIQGGVSAQSGLMRYPESHWSSRIGMGAAAPSAR